ncbi:MAG: hypothetical protein ABIR26_19615, partial [Ramlibacter sp.]
MWGVEANVLERFAAAGVAKEDVSCVKDTFTFRFPGTTAEFVDTFGKYYGPTMNAFEAAEKTGRADELRKELEALFASKNEATVAGTTVLPATFLRVTVQVR